MAKVYLESTDTAFTISNSNTTVYGAAGDQVVTVASGVTGVTYDQNTERVVFAGASSAYTYLQSGNQILVYSGGVLVATIPVQGDTTGTQLTFTNGTANAILTSGVMALGGTTVSSTAAATVTPTTIDTTVVSGTVTGGTVTGQAFTLTTSATADNLVLTTGNDTVTGAAGTLSSTDIITDTSTSDSDTFTVTVGSAEVSPRVLNVETINVDGQYASANLNLADISNAKTLNLNTGLQGGVVTLTNASALNAASVIAGANVGTVNVTAAAEGTRGTSYIDAANAGIVSVTGGAGTDNFDIKVKTLASLTLKTASANKDTHAIHVAGGTLTLDGDAAAKTVTLDNTTAALTVTMTDNQTIVGTDTASKWNITGDKDVTFNIADDADLTAISDWSTIGLTNSGTGVVTL